MARRKKHLAFYGNVVLPRVWCEDCRQMSLVVQGKRSCCGQKSYGPTKGRKRMSHPPQRRRQPSKKIQEKLLAQWEDACAYCCRPFGSEVLMYGKLRLVNLHWDHCVPFSFTQNNQSNNYLPACQWCNLWKTDMQFNNLEEAQVYVTTKWEAATSKTKVCVLSDVLPTSP